MKFAAKKDVGGLPKTSGVYLFYEPTSNAKQPTPIYIGKAVNIRERVKNHFFQPSYRDNLFMEKVSKVGFIETSSEIEALVLEANLIKQWQPQFNVTWKDDKNYFYIAVAKNNNGLPYLFITHQPNQKFKISNLKFKIQYVGPFVDGNALKKTLKFLRRVFPFYTASSHPSRPCPWCHLDLCPGPDPDPKAYKEKIKKLILILKGKHKKALFGLKKEMARFSKAQEFEKAAKARNQITALEQIMSHAKVLDSRSAVAATAGADAWKQTEAILRKILQAKEFILRIECYDISNIQGKQATGSMVVFKEGKPDKSQYRKFKIVMKQEPNDIAMLKEVLERRLNHPEWPLPQVMLIDGGKAQLNVAIKIKNEKVKSKNITVISIAKGRRELFIENKQKPISLASLPQDIYNLIVHLDDEAHRFAISYHKKLRKQTLLLK